MPVGYSSLKVGYSVLYAAFDEVTAADLAVGADADAERDAAIARSRGSNMEDVLEALVDLEALSNSSRRALLGAFSSQDNVKKNGANQVAVRWNQSIDDCIALCEGEPAGCTQVNYKKSSRGCFMLAAGGTLGDDSGFTLLTLCAPL